jgi:hypothetical protein
MITAAKLFLGRFFCPEPLPENSSEHSGGSISQSTGWNSQTYRFME